TAPQEEGNDPIHSHVGVGDIKVGEVPGVVCKAERLKASLGRTDEVKDDTHKQEGDYITDAYAVPAAAHGHKEVGGAGDDGNEHAHAEHDRHGLEPPRERTENKVVRTDHRIKEHLCPEGKDAQRIRIDGFVQRPWEVVVHQTERERHEPHAYTLVHIVSLNDRLTQPFLIEG